MLRTALLALPICAALLAQDPPPVPQATAPAVMEYSPGKPIVVPFECTNDDIRWAGMACSEDDPCPIYLELASVDGGGGRIFAAGNIHSEAVTLYSVLLASEDSGHSWHEASERIRGAGLEHIQLMDGSGWVGGQILFPISQDPFFLVAAEGLATWRQRPVFSEGHSGSIQQFAFDSKITGTLLLDLGPENEGGRYGRYETADGGDSWSVKELNRKPLQLKRTLATPVPASWRVRASNQAFQVEKRNGERWTVVAEFMVKVAACKPQQ